MGAWGYGIRQDDFVCDVIGSFEDSLKKGNSIAAATKEVRKEYSSELRDSDDGPLFWIGLAEAQWTFGGLDPGVLQHVKDDLESGRSLAAWEEDDRGLARRKAALEKFLAKIESPNPRPRKLPKIVIRPPKFQPGDCLSIRLSSGQFGAALVLAADHSNPEYGKNLIGVLDYLSTKKPPSKVFKNRQWLTLTHHSHTGRVDLGWYLPVAFRAAKDRIEVIGSVDLLDSDPNESNRYIPWAALGEQIIMQREWDARST